MSFVSRAGEKLSFALKKFNIDVSNKVCADFGSNTGGFVDCLLQNGALKVYSIETGYGVLDWNLRNNRKVVVMERTNAMHVELSEQVDFISIDVSWTPQIKIIPNALKNLKPSGELVSLVKPHYEASAINNFKKYIVKGKLNADKVQEVLDTVITQIKALNIEVVEFVESPVEGGKAGNTEYLLHLRPIHK